MNKKKVIVLMGGKTPEHEVSLISGSQVVRHLDEDKYEVLPVVVSRDGRTWELKTTEQILLYSPELLLKSRTKKLFKKEVGGRKIILQPESISQKAEVVFIALHGPFGEDGTIQGMLELVGVPYTGAGVLASALGMDKPMFRKVMRSERVRIPQYLIFEKNDDLRIVWRKFPLPVVVKPSSQGSSVGITIVHKKSQLAQAAGKAFSYGPKIIVEEYLEGTEIACGILGNKNPFALPLVEIIPKKEFFNYEAKYVAGMSEEIIPARISPKLTMEIKNLAIKVYKAIDCRGFGRVDMIICRGKPYVLEINTIPGLTPNSLLPKEAAVAGISYSEMLDKIIEFALENDKKIFSSN